MCLCSAPPLTFPFSWTLAIQRSAECDPAQSMSATLQGSRFAILHGDGPRPTFSVYAMRQDLKSSVRGVSLVGSQPSKQANCMFWSPQGKYMVLAGLKVRRVLCV